MHWLLLSVEFIIGCALLAWSANRFITASSAIANRLNWSSLMVGVLLVGFGTSFPEVVVSIIATVQGNPGLAIGNAFGSNIINIGLVIGLAAVITPLVIHSRLLWSEYPFLIASVVFIGLFLYDQYLSRFDGLLLLAFLAFYIYWMFFLVKKYRVKDDLMTTEYQSEISRKTMGRVSAIVWWLASLVILFVSSELIVHSAVVIAKALQVSDVVIGLTIVALGTSLPELAASIVSALRQEHDIAVGNVVGSNIFNLLGIIGIVSLISPTATPSSLLLRDYPAMFLLILLMWVLAYHPRGEYRIGRLSGCLLLAILMIYLVVIVLTANL